MSEGPRAHRRSRAARPLTVAVALAFPAVASAQVALPTTPSWLVASDDPSAYLGSSVAARGDVDGDGYDDVLAGAPQGTVTLRNEGRALLYRGSCAGPSVVADWSAAGGDDYSGFGVAVAFADADGDGFDDVVVGADGWAGEGAVFLYRGSPAGPSVVEDGSVVSGQAGARFGFSVASAGDVDGDGYEDVLAGAPYWTSPRTWEGAAFLYLGSPTGPSAAPDWSAEGDALSAVFGWDVASAGDVDGDGYDDVLVGAPWWTGAAGYEEGAAFLFLGSATGPSAVPDWFVTSGRSGATLGDSVSSAGDVDGDGYDDVLIGASSWNGGASGEGAAFLAFGSPTGPSTVPDWSVEGGQALALLGEVAAAGDVDRDGYDDLLVGAQAWDGAVADEGAVFLALGSPTGPSALPDWSAVSGQSDAGLGRAVATGGGDVDGDGNVDVVAGVPYLDGGERNEGAVVVYAAGSDAWTADADGDGTPDACDAPLALTVDPIVSGAPFRVTVTGASAGERVAFFGSPGPQGSGPCPGHLGGLCLDLGPPASLLGTAVADASGTASRLVTLSHAPPAGAVVTVQAAVRRGPAAPTRGRRTRWGGPSSDGAGPTRPGRACAALDRLGGRPWRASPSISG